MKHHELLGILTEARREKSGGKPEPFSLFERELCLGLTFAVSWGSVYLKYFHLKHWIHSKEFLSELELDPSKEINLFPDDALYDHLDSLLIAVASTSLDVLLGRIMVRKVLEKDWDHKGGVKSIVSTLANLWCAALTLGAVIHISVTLGIAYEKKPKVVLKLAIKLLSTLVLKLGFVETAKVTAQEFIASRKEQPKTE